MTCSLKRAAVFTNVNDAIGLQCTLGQIMRISAPLVQQIFTEVKIIAAIQTGVYAACRRT
jgi:hypothetical protein